MCLCVVHKPKHSVRKSHIERLPVARHRLLLYETKLSLTQSRDSSVATGRWVRVWTIAVLGFDSNGSGAHPTYCPMGTSVSYPNGKAASI
jgi:hypothetical protein